MHTFKKIIENRWSHIIIGILFMASGIIDIIETWEVETNIGSEHGMALFGFWHILRTLPDFFEGIEYSEQGIEQSSKSQ